MEIRFLSVGCGDCIHIRFNGDDLNFHNIIIDGGTELGNIYEETLRKTLNEIADRKERIELWIITHIDDDHIGGILRFIHDASTFNRFDLSKTIFWYNHSIWDYPVPIATSIQKSVKQGIRLREFIRERAPLQESITSNLNPIDFFGATITILSPSKEKLSRLLAKWKKLEIEFRKRTVSEKKAATSSDYKIKLEDFDTSKFNEDVSEENGSSIAWLLIYNQTSVLFTADSHPSELVQSLKQLGYSAQNKLAVNYMQIPHHGSKANVSDELLSLIACKQFVVSADGYNKHNLPSKEALAKIVKQVDDDSLKIYVTHKNSLTTSIFDVDQDKNKILEFPPVDSNGLTFHFNS